MKKIVGWGLMVVGLWLPLGAWGQETRYETDSTCGCDILYVDGIQTTREGERYGFRRDDGRVIAENIYLHVDKFTDGYCRVWLEDTLCGLISAEGEVVVPCLYDNVGLPSCGRIAVVKGERIGFTDMQGRLVIPTVFPNAYAFTEGRAAVTVAVDSFFYEGHFIDTMGRILNATPYESTLPYSDGYAPVKLYDRWGIIDTLGNMVVPTVYEEVNLMPEGILFAGDLGGMAFYNLRMQKTPLTPRNYLCVTAMSSGLIGVMRGDKYGFLDPKGKEVIACMYDEIGLFRLGRALVRLGDRYGIIDTTGRAVLPIEYENRTPKGQKYVYYDSLALVEKEGRLGYVDLEGRFVVPLKLEAAYHFSQGLAPVRLGGRWGYINSRGEVYLPFIFDIASPFRWGRAEVFFQGQRHKIDLQGKCLSGCGGIVSFR